MPFSRQLLFAWRQLSHSRVRLAVAVLGVAFANLMMFMQFGFQDALFDSATVVQRRLTCEVALFNPQATSLYFPQPFSRRLLHRLQAHPEVDAVFPLLVNSAIWKNPWTGKPRTIFVLGVDISEPTLDLPGLADGLETLRLPDSVLFDEYSRAEFGPVIEALGKGETVEAEVNRRRLRIVGPFRLGVSFAADGNILMSRTNFLRLYPDRRLGTIDFGLIRLRPGSDADAVAADLQALVGNELRVMTAPAFRAFEKAYWEEATAIGYIFTQGVLMGFLVGFVIVYQILHGDVSTHLPQYATMKAMGFSNAWLAGVVFAAALILSLLGFVPGVLLSAGLYEMTARSTNLPIALNLPRAAQVFGLTLLMCTLSGYFAMRKLRRADPADVF